MKGIRLTKADGDPRAVHKVREQKPFVLSRRSPDQFYAGRRRSEVKVSVHDGPADLAEQWAAMWRKVEAPDSVLLAHLEGHYSLIFAAREWTAGRITEESTGATEIGVYSVFDPTHIGSQITSITTC